MNYYIASCVFTSQFPELSLQIRDYIKSRWNFNIVRCCVPKYKIKDEEQTQYRKIIRKEFRESLADLENLRRKSNMKRVSLFLIGLFSFLIQMRLGEYIGTVISEIINIIGWVCIWEFIYSILFTAISRKNDIDRLRQILNAEIEFK